MDGSLLHLSVFIYLLYVLFEDTFMLQEEVLTKDAATVSAANNWGPCELVRVSSAGAFTAGSVFMRVVQRRNDPCGTLHVALLTHKTLRLSR